MTLFLLFVLAALSAAIIYVSLLPDKFRVARSIIIDASPEAIYPHINDLHAWEHWSPLTRLDSAATRNHEGSPLGAGAIFSWSGDPKQGAGAIKITASSPGERVTIRRRITKPFEATDELRFDLTPIGDATEVLWQASGTLDFTGKAVNLLSSLERKLGGQFEEGLRELKKRVEIGES